MTYIPNTDENRQAMLEAIGASSIEDLLSVVPQEVRLTRPLRLPPALSEPELCDVMAEIASQNLDADKVISFLGGGMYDHFIPSVIKHLTGRSEFLTAYTPYQPEVSQGTLQGIYEYQSMICELTGMDVANASMYDGASATAEAMLMAQAATRRRHVVIAGSVHPQYIETVRTYAHGPELPIDVAPCSDGILDLERMQELISDQTACVILQHPNFFGGLEPVADLEAIVHRAGALLVMVVDPISLGLLKSPGEYDADIVVGEGQSLGNQMSFGGPGLGVMATKERFLRRIPGRIAGKTVDQQGRRGFVLTLQAREQHIRRDKATSNICTSQQLNALMATIYLSIMGNKGLRRIAELCLHKSHYAAEKITGLQGYNLRFNTPFFREFVVQTPVAPGRIVHELTKHGIHAGVNLKWFPSLNLDDCLLIAVTERRTKAQIDRFVEALDTVR